MYKSTLPHFLSSSIPGLQPVEPLEIKMAPLLPTSASSSKPPRANSLYSFDDSYPRNDGVEAYTLPKGERGLPLVLRRLGKFKSMVCLDPIAFVPFSLRKEGCRSALM